MKQLTMLKIAIVVLVIAIVSYYTLWKLIYEDFGQEAVILTASHVKEDDRVPVADFPVENSNHASGVDANDPKSTPINIPNATKPVMEGPFSSNKEFLHKKNSVHLSLVACGDRLEESVVLLKSAVLLTDRPLVFHIFVEDDLQKNFQDQLEFWPDAFRSKIFYRIFSIAYPSDQDHHEWRKLFRPCASQRLFIPHILTDVDSLLYVDTDILFLSPVSAIWKLFDNFSTLQTTGLAPEHEDTATGWYNRFAQHPYFKPLGVNSGVMLMNLTRIRRSNWQPSILKYHKDYKYKIVYGDQDLINIYFHFHTDELYVFPCHWNYRPDHCMYMSVCKSAEHEGAAIIHGCRRVMHSDQQPAFKAVYITFKKHRLGADLQYKLLETLKRELESVSSTNCGKVGYIFSKRIEKEILAITQESDQKKVIPNTLT